MHSIAVIAISVSCLLIVGHASPVPQEFFGSLFQNFNALKSPSKEGDIVKRRTEVDNADATLKQISLQSFIGDLEHSLVQSALSVSSVAHSDDVVPEVAATTAHAIAKRNTESTSKSPLKGITIELPPEGQQLFIQTTEKVPQKAGVPAHIVIDRIEVHPHTGSLPLIPVFQVVPPKATTPSSTSTTTATEKIDSSSSRAVTKAANIEATTVGTHLKASEASKTESISSSTSSTPSTTSHISSSTSSSTSTTKLPVVQLIKQAEKELKEKVAEIEAEPVILSARV